MEMGKKPHPITADTYYKCDPAWSPVESRFVGNFDGRNFPAGLRLPV